MTTTGFSSSQTRSGETLADILERVLDKGIVIAGDVVVNVLDIELLTLKLRLVIASVDTAKQMGIDWWRDDPFLSRDAQSLQQENQELRRRIEQLTDGTATGNGNAVSGNATGAGNAVSDSAVGGSATEGAR